MANLHKSKATPPLPGRLVLVISGHAELAACEDLDPRLITQKEPRTDGQGPRQKQHGARDSPHGPASTNYCLAAERRYKEPAGSCQFSTRPQLLPGHPRATRGGGGQGLPDPEG